MELIKISEQNGKQAVSARDLHAFLESKRDFSNWIKDRIEKYGFIENQDFILLNNFGEQTGRVLKKLNCPRTLAIQLSKKAAKICKERNILTDSTPDPRFGSVKLYPYSILEEVVPAFL